MCRRCTLNVYISVQIQVKPVRARAGEIKRNFQASGEGLWCHEWASPAQGDGFRPTGLLHRCPLNGFLFFDFGAGVTAAAPSAGHAPRRINSHHGMDILEHDHPRVNLPTRLQWIQGHPRRQLRHGSSRTCQTVLILHMLQHPAAGKIVNSVADPVPDRARGPKCAAFLMTCFSDFYLLH